MTNEQQSLRQFPMDYPFRNGRLINGAVFGTCIAALLVGAWVLYQNAQLAAANHQVAAGHRFTTTALLFKAAPTGVDYVLELGVLNAADAQEARTKFSVYVKQKNPEAELKDVMAMDVQQGG